MISQVFNESIASKVEDLTRIKVNKKIPAGETLELVYPQNKKDILYIKLFDRLHNMRTIAFLPEIKRNKVIDENCGVFCIPLFCFRSLRGQKRINNIKLPI